MRPRASEVESVRSLRAADGHAVRLLAVLGDDAERPSSCLELRVVL